MPPVFHLILLVLAVVLFGVATFQPTSSNPDRLRLACAGLTALALSMISW